MRAGVRHHHVHGGHQRPVAPHGNDAARGGVGAEPIVRRRCAPAGPGLLGESEGREACRRRGAGPVGRAGSEGGGEEVRVVGAFGTPVETALHAPVGHRRHVGQPDQHRSCRAQPFDGEGVALGHQVLEGGRACGGGEALGQITVLGRIRDAVQRTERLTARAPLVRGAGVGQRLIIHDDDGVQPGAGPVVGGNALQVGLGEFLAGGLAGLQRLAQLRYRGFHHVERAHQASVVPSAGCCWVMQWIPPPRARMGRASTVTTRRPG